VSNVTIGVAKGGYMYIMFVSQTRTRTPSCSTADLRGRYGVPRLSIDAQVIVPWQFKAVDGLSALHSALAYRTCWMAMAETMHNDTRISEPESTGSTSYEQEQVQNILARCYSSTGSLQLLGPTTRNTWTGLLAFCVPLNSGVHQPDKL